VLQLDLKAVRGDVCKLYKNSWNNTNKINLSSALTKRATRRYTITVIFIITFVQGCYFPCQTRNGPILQQILLVILQEITFIFTSVPIFRNGIYIGSIPQIQFFSVIYVSPIRMIITL
jgi:hypothetical protein